MKLKEESSQIKGEENYLYKDIGENWIYKTRSIREIIPRIFIETALIKVFNFKKLYTLLNKEKIKPRIIYLSNQVRCIGNISLVFLLNQAAYFSTFLIRIASENINE